MRPDRAVSSAEEHILDMDGVAGSIPAPPTRRSGRPVPSLSSSLIPRSERGVAVYPAFTGDLVAIPATSPDAGKENPGAVAKSTGAKIIVQQHEHYTSPCPRASRA